MKKMKKFAAGGRFVDDGESQRYVEDAPADVPVAAGIAPVRGGPVSAGLAPVLSDTAGGFQDNMDRPDVVARPMGLMVPRGRGLGASLAGMGALRASGMKKGGAVKKMAKGGSTSSASKRADGCAIKGKTKGRFV